MGGVVAGECKEWADSSQALYRLCDCATAGLDTRQLRVNPTSLALRTSTERITGKTPVIFQVFH